MNSIKFRPMRYLVEEEPDSTRTDRSRTRHHIVEHLTPSTSDKEKGCVLHYEDEQNENETLGDFATIDTWIWIRSDSLCRCQVCVEQTNDNLAGKESNNQGGDDKFNYHGYEPGTAQYTMVVHDKIKEGNITSHVVIFCSVYVDNISSVCYVNQDSHVGYVLEHLRALADHGQAMIVPVIDVNRDKEWYR